MYLPVFCLELDPIIISKVLLLLRAVSKRKSSKRHHDLVRINKPMLNWKFPHEARTMVRRYLSVSKKLDIVDEARDSGNLYATAQKHDVQPNQTSE